MPLYSLRGYPNQIGRTGWDKTAPDGLHKKQPTLPTQQPQDCSTTREASASSWPIGASRPPPTEQANHTPISWLRTPSSHLFLAGATRAEVAGQIIPGESTFLPSTNTEVWATGRRGVYRQGASGFPLCRLQQPPEPGSAQGRNAIRPGRPSTPDWRMTSPNAFLILLL